MTSGPTIWDVGGTAGVDGDTSVTGRLPLLTTLLVSVAAAVAGLPVVLGVHRQFLPIDLLVYQAGGQAVRLGIPLYDGVLRFAGIETLDFTYPPVAALLFVPLSFMESWVATLVVTALTMAAVAAIVAISFGRLLLRAPARTRPWAFSGLVAGAVLTLPVAHVLSFGQVGAFVVLACLWDVVGPARPWRGVLIGVATAVKIVPGLFIVHLLVTRQWRAAITASATTAGLWGVAALLLPSDSRRYFLDGALLDTDRVTSQIDLVTNQSIRGLLERADLPAGWLPLAALVAVFGLVRARRAHLAHDRLAAATLVGLTTLLVSPVSWVHHAVWLVPAIGVLVGDGASVRRTLAAVAAWLLACLAPVGPVIAELIADGTVQDPLWMAVLRESLVVLIAVLLATLPIARQPRPPG